MDYSKLDIKELTKLSEAGDKKAKSELESRWTFKGWYKKHGGQLNESRRDRYKSDPEYRNQVLEANRSSRAKRREELTKERAAERSAIKVKVSRQYKEVSSDIDGKDVKLMTIGALAKALHRSKLGVRLLEKKGVIPKAPVHNKQGERLYPPEMIEEIKKLMKAQGRFNDQQTHTVPMYINCELQLSDGVLATMPLFRVGALAEAVSRSTITLEQMERRGVLPETPFRLPPNRRAYTELQIKAVCQAFEKRNGDLRGVPIKEIHDEIYKSWEDAKVIGAKFLGVSPTTEGKSHAGKEEP